MRKNLQIEDQGPQEQSWPTFLASVTPTIIYRMKSFTYSLWSGRRSICEVEIQGNVLGIRPSPARGLLWLRYFVTVALACQ